jgi:hypothetical protein
MAEAISSREVDAELRALIWPALWEIGFTDRTRRVAWKDYAHTVAVVDFWSFNSYTAATMGVTTLSFQLNLGIVRCSSNGAEFVKVKDGKLRPKEPECDVRRVLWKTIQQPQAELPQIWYVREDGSNLREVVENARLVLLTTGRCGSTSSASWRGSWPSRRTNPTNGTRRVRRSPALGASDDAVVRSGRNSSPTSGRPHRFSDRRASFPDTGAADGRTTQRWV